MIDSIGKPPSNILGGGFTWLGDYEECLDVKATTAVNNVTYSFGGQYCSVQVVNLEAVPPVLPKVCGRNVKNTLVVLCYYFNHVTVKNLF